MKLSENINFSRLVTVFQEKTAPEEGYIVGYGALYEAFDIKAPIPEILALISQKHKQYQTREWIVLTPRHMPEDTLMGHLTFALKYEGINLGILKKLFEKLDPKEIAKLISEEPTGQYARCSIGNSGPDNRKLH